MAISKCIFFLTASFCTVSPMVKCHCIIDFVNKNPFNKVLKPQISKSTVISSSLCRVQEEVIISFVLTKSFPYNQIRHVVTPNIDLHASRGRCLQYFTFSYLEF